MVGLTWAHIPGTNFTSKRPFTRKIPGTVLSIEFNNTHIRSPMKRTVPLILIVLATSCQSQHPPHPRFKCVQNEDEALPPVCSTTVGSTTIDAWCSSYGPCFDRTHAYCFRRKFLDAITWECTTTRKGCEGVRNAVLRASVPVFSSCDDKSPEDVAIDE